jgi:hypothetical protein
MVIVKLEVSLGELPWLSGRVSENKLKAKKKPEISPQPRQTLMKKVRNN